MSDYIENYQTPTPPPEQRRVRVVQLAVVSTLVAAAIAAIAITSGGSRTPRLRDSQRLGVEHQIDTLLRGLPQRANLLGRPTAPITLRWFGDLECPFCKEFTFGALPSIIRSWVRGGQLKIEYFSMETATREPRVFEKQEIAALAAGRQNKMWNYIETFYHEQGEEGSAYVTERYLDGIASQIGGLNRPRWAEDRYDPELAARISAELRLARKERFTGTPTFLIGRSEGALVRFSPQSLIDPKPFDVAIEYLLDKGRSATAIPAAFGPDGLLALAPALT